MSESRQIAVLLQPEPQQLFRFPCVVPSLSIQLPCLLRSRAMAKTLELLVFSDLGRLVSQLTSHDLDFQTKPSSQVSPSSSYSTL